VDLERDLASVEALLGIRVLLRDISGRLRRLEAGNPAIWRRRSYHRPHPVCGIGYGKACLEHCAGSVLERAARAEAPFRHQCWKALQEIVVPVRVEGSTVAVLFAGVWTAEGVDPPPLPAAWRELHGELRPLPSERAAHLENTLTLLADGLARRITEVEALDPPETRRAVIQKYLSQNAVRPVTIRDLAGHLGLSPSRAGHLVRELFGVPFERLLRDERVTRARKLLVTSDATASQIAAWTGFSDEFYFNRVFKKATGVTPGQYRRGAGL
jgi:AraC-like DNA-binding protein